MRRRYGLIVLAFVAALALHGIACAHEPVKWSAPLNAYPNSWAPTTPPPPPVNQYASQYPNWGPYGGYQPHTQAAHPWQRAYAPGFSGNPYMRSYAP